MADDEVKISQAELRELLANTRATQDAIADMKKENAELRGLLKESQGPRVLRSITDRKVTVRRVDGKVVVGYKNRGVEARPQYVYEKVDPNDKNNKLLFVDLILEDGTELSVNYNEFLREAEQVECKIVKTDEKTWTIEQGYVKRKEVDEYSTVELPVDVPVEITGTVRIFTVAIPEEDRTVEVHEMYVNI